MMDANCSHLRGAKKNSLLTDASCYHPKGAKRAWSCHPQKALMMAWALIRPLKEHCVRTAQS